jgi:hypothetical protein
LAVPLGVTADLAGNPRIGDANVDMGVFEFYTAWDLKKDSHWVDLLDIAIFADNWLETDCEEANNWCEGADIDKNGEVGFADLSEMVEHWLEGPP